MDIEQKNNGQENLNHFNGEAESNQTSTSTESDTIKQKNVNKDSEKQASIERMNGIIDAKAKEYASDSY